MFAQALETWQPMLQRRMRLTVHASTMWTSISMLSAEYRGTSTFSQFRRLCSHFSPTMRATVTSASLIHEHTWWST